MMLVLILVPGLPVLLPAVVSCLFPAVTSLKRRSLMGSVCIYNGIVMSKRLFYLCKSNLFYPNRQQISKKHL